MTEAGEQFQIQIYDKGVWGISHWVLAIGF
jgi:hypothetical protein